MGNLPADEKRDLTTDELRRIIEATGCVGIIPREGKDAAGKALESEYYYIPEMDSDASRRAAVVDGLRKPSLRNCRKQHKVSFAVLIQYVGMMERILTFAAAILLEATTNSLMGAIYAEESAPRCWRCGWMERCLFDVEIALRIPRPDVPC